MSRTVLYSFSLGGPLVDPTKDLDGSGPAMESGVFLVPVRPSPTEQGGTRAFRCPGPPAFSCLPAKRCGLSLSPPRGLTHEATLARGAEAPGRRHGKRAALMVSRFARFEKVPRPFWCASNPRHPRALLGAILGAEMTGHPSRATPRTVEKRCTALTPYEEKAGPVDGQASNGHGLLLAAGGGH